LCGRANNNFAHIDIGWLLDRERDGTCNCVGRDRHPIPCVHDLGLHLRRRPPFGCGATLTAEQIATLEAVSKPVLSFPAGYAQICQMSGFPGTTIDGVQTPPSPMLSASTARY
jgi:hypothetical protein